MRETRLSGSEGGGAQTNAPSLPLSTSPERDAPATTSPERDAPASAPVWRLT